MTYNVIVSFRWFWKTRTKLNWCTHTFISSSLYFASPLATVNSTPTVAASHWRSQEPCSSQSTGLGASVVPVWSLKPGRFLESGWSSVIENSGSDISSEGIRNSSKRKKITWWQEGQPRAIYANNLPPPPAFFLGSHQSCKWHLRWALPHKLRQLKGSLLRWI